MVGGGAAQTDEPQPCEPAGALTSDYMVLVVRGDHPHYQRPGCADEDRPACHADRRCLGWQRGPHVHRAVGPCRSGQPRQNWPAQPLAGGAGDGGRVVGQAVAAISGYSELKYCWPAANCVPSVSRHAAPCTAFRRCVSKAWTSTWPTGGVCSLVIFPRLYSCTNGGALRRSRRALLGRRPVVMSGRLELQLLGCAKACRRSWLA